MRNKLFILLIVIAFVGCGNIYAQYGKERTNECSKKKEAYLEALVNAKMKEYQKIGESLKVKIEVTEEDIRKAGLCSFNRLMKDIDVNCEYFMDLKNPKIYNRVDHPCEDHLPDIVEIYKKAKNKK